MHRIVGVDCAAQDQGCGIALGYADGGGAVRLLSVETGLRSVVPTLTRWITGSSPVLLALDAPLGWPAPLGRALDLHQAGEPIPQSPDDLFHRHTDRIVRSYTNKRPMEVGADRIARTAHRAIRLLGELRADLALPIPLAWEPGPQAATAAIEVYPAITLRSRGLSESGYKGSKAQHRSRRLELRGELKGEVMGLGEVDQVVDSDDALDAVVCLLAAADFLAGDVVPPGERAIARREGWIWFKPAPKGSGVRAAAIR
jgi:hypothetical protein